MTDSSDDSSDPENHTEKQKVVPPRKKWIDACWAMWCQDISAKKNPEAVDMETETEGNPNPGRPMGIQRWRTFLRKSWSLMLQELDIEELPEPEEDDDNLSRSRVAPWARFMMHGGCGRHGGCGGRFGHGGPKWHMMKHWGPPRQGRAYRPIVDGQRHVAWLQCSAPWKWVWAQVPPRYGPNRA